MPKINKPPKVAIVGRANVGKSTLWNRLTESGKAIISASPGTTRDKNYAPCLWRGAVIEVIDTGGMDTDKNDIIEAGIKKQALSAIKEADLVLFLIDAKSGVLPQDIELAKEIKNTNNNILLVANKVDSKTHLGQSLESGMWKLGFGEPITVSASSGRGVGDLLDQIFTNLRKIKKPPAVPEEKQSLKIVIMGRPNVGKSSIVNAIVGHERSIVSPIAHTTREPLDTQITWQSQPVTLVDTAGMRKRSNITSKLEHEAIDRNREALKRADVAVLVVDATDDPRKQDKHLAGLLEDAHKGLIIVANKWDLVKDKTTKTANEFETHIRSALPFLAWSPIIFTSAKNRQRVNEILNTAFKIKEERNRIVSDNALSKFLKKIIALQSPKVAAGNKAPYIHEIIQTHTDPPTFVIKIRGNQNPLQKAWISFVENQIRKKFGFQGTPMIIKTQFDPTPMEVKPGPNRRKRPMGRKGFRY